MLREYLNPAFLRRLSTAETHFRDNFISKEMADVSNQTFKLWAASDAHVATDYLQWFDVCQEP